MIYENTYANSLANQNNYKTPSGIILQDFDPSYYSKEIQNITSKTSELYKEFYENSNAINMANLEVNSNTTALLSVISSYSDTQVKLLEETNSNIADLVDFLKSSRDEDKREEREKELTGKLNDDDSSLDLINSSLAELLANQNKDFLQSMDLNPFDLFGNIRRTGGFKLGNIKNIFKAGLKVAPLLSLGYMGYQGFQGYQNPGDFLSDEFLINQLNENGGTSIVADPTQLKIATGAANALAGNSNWTWGESSAMDIASGLAGNALKLGTVGFSVAGPWGAAIGAAVGAILNAIGVDRLVAAADWGKQVFDDLIGNDRKIEDFQKKSEELQKIIESEGGSAILAEKYNYILRDKAGRKLELKDDGDNREAYEQINLELDKNRSKLYSVFTLGYAAESNPRIKDAVEYFINKNPLYSIKETGGGAFGVKTSVSFNDSGIIDENKIKEFIEYAKSQGLSEEIKSGLLEEEPNFQLSPYKVILNNKDSEGMVTNASGIIEPEDLHQEVLVTKTVKLSNGKEVSITYDANLEGDKERATREAESFYNSDGYKVMKNTGDDNWEEITGEKGAQYMLSDNSINISESNASDMPLGVDYDWQTAIAIARSADRV